jgi:carbonic anhydrase/acetyltransferase-like protein (isoleucine patch superfamily)
MSGSNNLGDRCGQIHPTAVIHADATIGDTRNDGYATVGADVMIGAYAVLNQGVVVERDAVIGAYAVLHEDVSVGPNAIIGREAIVGPGVTIPRGYVLPAGAVVFDVCDVHEPIETAITAIEYGEAFANVSEALHALVRSKPDEGLKSRTVAINNRCLDWHNLPPGDFEALLYEAHDFVVAECLPRGIAAPDLGRLGAFVGDDTPTTDPSNLFVAGLAAGLKPQARS